MPESANIQDEEWSLTDLLLVLLRNRRIVFWIVGTAFLVSVAYSLLAQKRYTASVTLFPPQQGVSMLGLAMSQMPQQTLEFGGMFGQSSLADLWMAVLESRTVLEPVIKEFDLMTQYEAETLEDAEKVLSSNLSVKTSKTEVISIAMEDPDPRRAVMIVEAVVKGLDRVNQSQESTAGRRIRVFVEKRLQEEKQALEKAEEAVRVFQETNGAVQLDAQSKAIIDTIGEVRGQLMAKEVELQTTLSYASRSNPEVDLLKTQVSELKAHLRRLEEGTSGRSRRSILIPTDKIPKLVLQYTRLLRDAKVKDTLYNLLIEQYERARIQEAKDTPTVQVLEKARVPVKRSSPKRTLIVILSTGVATLFSVMLVFGMEFWRNFRAEWIAAKSSERP